jgi:tRNA-dihydrouridine synthase
VISGNLLETKLILAPIRGITDCHFRTIFHRYFPGFDLALAPFINPQRASNFQPNQIKDLLPEANPTLPVIPQLLHTDVQDFLFLANRLASFGYKEINWNLGCPAPMVTKKKRGSGLLPYPDEILTFLDQVMEKLPIQLSIKTRLGLEGPEELLHLLPKLDQYPLTEIIIHGRLGKQLYKGTTDRENFARCLQQTKHSIVYNGDIKTTEDFKTLQTQFPDINKWMIGRGVLSDPFLAGEIKGIQQQAKTHLLQCFHTDLFECYRELLAGEAHLLGRMKQLWAYLSVFFPPAQKTWKKINKCTTEEKYLRITKECFSMAATD